MFYVVTRAAARPLSTSALSQGFKRLMKKGAQLVSHAYVNNL